MKRMIIGLFVAVSVIMFSGSAMAATIVGGPHDLQAEVNTAGGDDGTNAGEICIYCHTPHNANMEYPLWNRTSSASAFTGYTSSTIEMTIPVNLAATSPSRQCLSCHDGVTNVDAVVNGQVSLAPGVKIGNAAFLGQNGDLGIDLTNDHPVGFAYDTSADAAFNTIAQVTGAGLRLYAGFVECGSCHDVHGANSKFLRIANTGSAVCLACHIK